MRPLLRGLFVSLLLILDTALLVTPLLLLAVLRILPGARWRRRCGAGVLRVAEAWLHLNRALLLRLLPTRWDIRGAEGLRREASYLVVCNHQSWVDIPALLEALAGRTPFFRFFVKQELIWVPFLGLAFWALDYPFMKRYSRACLAKRPHLRGRDLEAARRACARFSEIPATIVNYLEGTRFTPAKHAAQQSPYRHLLRPRSGGLALAFGALGERLEAILDVTLVYPGERAPGFWALLSGQVPWVIVDIRRRPVEAWQWQGDYENDPAFRQRMQAWVSQLWEDKDRRIAALRDAPAG